MEEVPTEIAEAVAMRQFIETVALEKNWLGGNGAFMMSDNYCNDDGTIIYISILALKKYNDLIVKYTRKEIADWLMEIIKYELLVCNIEFMSNIPVVFISDTISLREERILYGNIVEVTFMGSR